MMTTLHSMLLLGCRDGTEFIPPLTAAGDQLVPTAGAGVSILAAAAAGVGWRDTELIPPPPTRGVGWRGSDGAW